MLTSLHALSRRSTTAQAFATPPRMPCPPSLLQKSALMLVRAGQSSCGGKTAECGGCERGEGFRCS
eukprot:100638-Chlamydomonas_euryale.AAC.1